MRKAGWLGMLAMLVAAACGCGDAPDTPLGRAAAAGRAAEVARLLDAGADPDLADRAGMTPLAWAARFDRVPVVEALLDGGADPDAVAGSNGWSPLTHAVHHGSDAAARVLIERRTGVSGPSGRRALLMAAGYGNATIVRALVRRGVRADEEILLDAVGGAWDIDARCAGCGPHTEVVRALLVAQPDLRLPRGPWAWLARRHARRHGCDELLEMLDGATSADPAGGTRSVAVSPPGSPGSRPAGAP